MMRCLRFASMLLGILAAACGDVPVNSIDQQYSLSSETVYFGPVWVGETSERQVGIRNDGPAGLYLEFRGVGAPFDGPAEVALAVGEAKAVGFVFSPTASGIARAEVSVFAGNLPRRELVLTGEGAAPTLAVAPDLDFGSVRVGDNRELTLAVRNEGPLPTPDLGFRIEGPDEEAFSITRGIASLGPHATDELGVSFSAAAKRDYRATLALGSCDWCETTTIELRGRGVETELEAAPSRLEFPTIGPGNNRTLALQIWNRGGFPADLTSLELTGTAYSIDQTAFPAVLGQDEYLELPITFAPEVPGDFAGNLHILDGAGEVALVVSIFGHCGGPVLLADPETVDLGRLPVGRQEGARIALRRGGEEGPLALGAARIEGDPAWSLVTPALPVPIGSSALPVHVVFASDAVGPSEATLVLSPSDPAWPEARVPLKALVVDDACQLEVYPSPLRFGAVDSAALHQRILYIRNDGPGPCIIWDFWIDQVWGDEILGDGFTVFEKTDLFELGPGEQRVIGINFFPAGPTSDVFRGTIRFRTSNVGAPERAVDVSAWPATYSIYAYTDIENFGEPMLATIGETARISVNLGGGYGAAGYGYRLMSAGLSSITDSAFSVSSAPPIPWEFRDDLAVEVAFTPMSSGDVWGELEFGLEAIVGSPPTRVPFLQPVVMHIFGKGVAIEE